VLFDTKEEGVLLDSFYDSRKTIPKLNEVPREGRISLMNRDLKILSKILEYQVQNT
jgi:hypothetical protein